MLSEDSRYFQLEDREHVDREGRRRIYKERRLIRATDPAVGRTTLQEGERLDLLAARVFKDSRLYWKLCDTNEIMNPFELDGESGKTLLVPER